MKPLFVDTSFYVALVNDRDGWHKAALDLSRQLNRKLLMTEYVLIELGNWLAESGDRAVLGELIRDLASDPNTEIVPSGHALFEQGLDLYGRRRDKEWSFTDCITFVVMAHSGVTEALTTDHHFEQAGFQRLLK